VGLVAAPAQELRRSPTVVDHSALLAVGAIALGMAVTPGPNVIYLVARSVEDGRRAGLICLGGVGLGYCLHLAAAVLGLAAVLLAAPEVYALFKLIGAAYLAWLAWKALRPATAVYLARHREKASTSPTRLFTMGLVTNVLNPKPPIMYAALIPQFVTVGAGNLLGQAVILGGTHIAVSLLTHVGLVSTAPMVAAFLGRKPAWLRLHRYATGALLAGFALELAVGTAGGA
jgi:threonine/homoserine/homoserine lactone efflux protein